ncbi:DUF1565 domain-containing protein [Actinomycetes bacterium KLBMP 9797]
MARRTRLAVVVTAALAAGAVGIANVAFADTLLADDFADGNSTGWTSSGGTWAVAGGAYRQSGTTLDARSLAGTASWTDYTVTAKVTPTAFNGSNRFVALLARTQSATSYYYVALRSNNTVELKRLTNGSATTLASGSVTVSAGTAYTLSLEVSGSTLRGSVNGGAVLTATDAQYAAGGVGLATYYATADFDDVTVSSGGVTPTPTATAPTSPPPSTPPPANGLVVATNGNDANPGTLSAPLATIQRAVDLVQPGGTILIRGGTYAPSTNIQILKNGTASQPITMRNYNNERVILDGENMPHTPAPVGGSIPRPERGAIHIEGDYWRLIGLEIIHGPYGVFGLDSSNNYYERLVTRDNYESGFHLFLTSNNNQIINLDSYGNFDPRNEGESADGLAIKEGSGTGNVVRGARLWNNSDDGLDWWMFSSPILVENSLAWGNGFNRWNLPNFTGDGNGFKLGGNAVVGNHTVRNSMTWDNAVSGFIDNNNPGQHRIERCTAWDNPGVGFDFDRSTSTLTRNLSVANGTAVQLGSTSTGSGNSWDIGGSWSLVSTDPSVITGPRTASGDIPSSTFLRPSNGADVGARF